ncbi:MAG: hypothetical protein ACLPY1_08055 [Terracidiphilus sp.]
MRMLAFVLIAFAGTLSAQQPAPAAPAVAVGQVTGRVSCADTGQPARFASVQLVSENPEANPTFDAASMGKNPDIEKAIAKAMAAVMKGNNLSTATGLDGSFSLDKVSSGTYYVVAQLAGYQSPFSQLSAMERVKADDATLKAVEAAAEKVVVQAGQSAHLEIRLERGSSIGGTIRYDDGSPAPGVMPVLIALGKDGKWKDLSPSAMMPFMTDDRGHYRIFGIAAGKYAIKATLPTMQTTTGLGASVNVHMSMGDALIVYSGGALHEKDVKPVEVGRGDDVEGVDVIFPLDNLHAVSGSVVAKADNHPIDAGTIVLQDADTKATVRSTMVEQDGSFHLNYVPEGQYLLHVSGAGDTDSAGGDSGSDLVRMMHTKILKSYGDAELPVTVKNDAVGLVLQVPDQGATPAIVPKPPGPPPPPASAPGAQ